MNSRERLLASLNHEEPDVVPNNPRIFAWFLEYYGAADYRTCLRAAEEFDFDPVISVRLGPPDVITSQIDTYEHFPEIEVSLSISQDKGVARCRRTILTPAGRLEDEMLYPPPGGVYGISPNPEKLEYLVKDENDLEKLRYLLPDPFGIEHPVFEKIRREVAGGTLLEVRGHAGCDHLLVDSFGLVNSMIAYYDRPEMFNKLVSMLAAYYRRCILRALDFEPDILFDSWYNCSLSAGWSPEIWRECFFPHIRANRELARRAGVYYHYYDDGKIMALLREIRELSPDILSTLCPPPVGDADLAVLKNELGDAVCLNGGVDLQTILRGTPDDVRREVKNVIDTAARGGGLWLGTSDSIRDGSPLANVKAYFSAAREYGRYAPR